MGEVVYSTNDLSKLLGVKPSTVRKYAKAFEDAGYKFHKNEFGHRGFFEKDAMLFRKLIDLRSDPNMTLWRAVNAVMSTIDKESVAGDATVAIAGQWRYSARYDSEVLEELRAFQKRQEEFNRLLLERIEQRDRQLMAVLREIQETRKEIVAAQKEKKKWWMFWKK